MRTRPAITKYWSGKGASMTRSTSLKTVLLAAASLAAAGAAAAPLTPSAPFEPAPIEHAVAADQHRADARAADIGVNRWLAGGAIAAALAGLIRLFGWARISAALQKAGKAAMEAPAAAIRYAGDVVRSPLRFLLIVGGLSLFALVGVGFYDVEWIAGVATGAAIVLAGSVGFRKLARGFARR